MSLITFQCITVSNQKLYTKGELLSRTLWYYLEVLKKEIIEAEDNFLKNSKDFRFLETSVKAYTENFYSSFLRDVC